MKLYATTTSERASKGQGGNYLDIEIMGANKVVIARIKVSEPYPYEYKLDVFPVAYHEKGLVMDLPYSSIKITPNIWGHGYRVKRIEPKGNNQKGERIGGDDRQFKDWPINGA